MPHWLRIMTAASDPQVEDCTKKVRSIGGKAAAMSARLQGERRRHMQYEPTAVTSALAREVHETSREVCCAA
jgi:hypothetical protein